MGGVVGGKQMKHTGQVPQGKIYSEPGVPTSLPSHTLTIRLAIISRWLDFQWYSIIII